MVNANITGELAKVAGLVARAHPDCAVQIIYEDGQPENLWLLRADNGAETVAEYIVNDETGETEPALPVTPERLVAEARAAKFVLIAQRIREVAGTPREVFTGEHAIAQGHLASLAVDLADAVLDARHPA